MKVVETLFQAAVSTVSAVNAVQRRLKMRRARWRAEAIRPTLVKWLRGSGNHEPKCGRGQKGDLLRWVTVDVNGKPIRAPSIRVDMLDQVVDGKVKVKGVELLKWIASKLDRNARSVLIALTRGQK